LSVRKFEKKAQGKTRGKSKQRGCREGGGVCEGVELNRSGRVGARARRGGGGGGEIYQWTLGGKERQSPRNPEGQTYRFK